MQRHRKKDLLLRARVVVRTSNMKIHVVVWQTTSKNYTKKRAARAARLFFLIQSIKSLICGVIVATAVVISLTPCCWIRACALGPVVACQGPGAHKHPHVALKVLKMWRAFGQPVQHVSQHQATML